MAARSIASLTLSFGLVSIPVRLYTATESSASVKFNMLAPNGARLKQQYIAEDTQRVVPRSEMVKGYEVETDKFVLFTAEELKKLEEGRSHVVDIVAFIPEKSVDPLFYDKAYLLAPDKRGGKPYSLLMEAMRKSGRCALAKWAWKTKQYVVQVRPAENGLVLQQLLYAEEVRSLKDLNIEHVDVSSAELQLALPRTRTTPPNSKTRRRSAYWQPSTRRLLERRSSHRPTMKMSQWAGKSSTSWPRFRQV